ncbi:MAG: hypothetical protein PHE89_03810 [Alphaproteobacteria bacterium]|nr:hypothetical protein [Alphaproteobacteria bacterium]
MTKETEYKLIYRDPWARMGGEYFLNDDWYPSMEECIKHLKRSIRKKEMKYPSYYYFQERKYIIDGGETFFGATKKLPNKYWFAKKRLTKEQVIKLKPECVWPNIMEREGYETVILLINGMMDNAEEPCIFLNKNFESIQI